MSQAEDVSTRELWHVEFRVDDDSQWNMIGTEREDLPTMVRLFDYWEQNNSDVQLRMRQTNVAVKTVDVEELRKRVAELESAATTE